MLETFDSIGFLQRGLNIFFSQFLILPSAILVSFDLDIINTKMLYVFNLWRTSLTPWTMYFCTSFRIKLGLTLISTYLKIQRIVYVYTDTNLEPRITISRLCCLSFNIKFDQEPTKITYLIVFIIDSDNLVLNPIVLTHAGWYILFDWSQDIWVLSLGTISHIRDVSLLLMGGLTHGTLKYF